MPRIRYTGPIEELVVAPAGRTSFTVIRLEWVDVATDVAGRRPSGTPGGKSYDPGEGLLAQGEWKLEPTKKAATTRAASEKE